MKRQSLVIGLAGDVMIGRNVDYELSRKGPAYAWGNLLPLLHSTDINLVNLETTLTTSNNKVFKTFNFKAAPDKIQSLTQAGISIVNLANNHILDYSEEGLFETIDTLHAAGIPFVGAGRNEEEAARPAIISKNDINVGVLGFTDNEAGWKAGPSTAGVNYIDIDERSDKDSALSRLEHLKKITDMVIVSIHWGPNMNPAPAISFIRFAHEMIMHGADIIHGHSAHNFQGIEVFNRRLIFYDTGDFIDDYVVHPDLKNDHSFFYRVELDKEHIIKASLDPVLISDCQVNLATGDDVEWSLKRMQHLSKNFGTQITDRGEIFFDNPVG